MLNVPLSEVPVEHQRAWFDLPDRRTGRGSEQIDVSSVADRISHDAGRHVTPLLIGEPDEKARGEISSPIWRCQLSFGH